MKMTSNDEELQAQGKMLNKVVAFCMEAAEKRRVTAQGYDHPLMKRQPWRSLAFIYPVCWSCPMALPL